LDKGDAKSTSGLRRHVSKCWGAETVKLADGTKDLEAAHAILLKTKLHDGTITAEFERIGKGKVTYSHRQHTSTESTVLYTAPQSSGGLHWTLGELLDSRWTPPEPFLNLYIYTKYTWSPGELDLNSK